MIHPRVQKPAWNSTAPVVLSDLHLWSLFCYRIRLVTPQHDYACWGHKIESDTWCRVIGVRDEFHPRGYMAYFERHGSLLYHRLRAIGMGSGAFTPSRTAAISPSTEKVSAKSASATIWKLSSFKN